MDININPYYIPLVIFCIPWVIVLLATLFEAEQMAFIWTFIGMFAFYIVAIIYAIIGIIWLWNNLHIHWV